MGEKVRTEGTEVSLVSRTARMPRVSWRICSPPELWEVDPPADIQASTEVPAFSTARTLVRKMTFYNSHFLVDKSVFQIILLCRKALNYMWSYIGASIWNRACSFCMVTFYTFCLMALFPSLLCKRALDGFSHHWNRAPGALSQVLKA